jgi:surfeit locus 1 family protein
MRAKGLVTFSLFMAATLALLIGLGVWQLQRLEWKEGLIAKIEARTKAPPVPLAEAVRRAGAGEDVSYLRVRAEGSFEHAHELYLYALSDGEAGWHVITPLKTEAGGTVLVDRGFVPGDKQDPAARAEGQIAGPVSIVGLARMKQAQAMFDPDNEPGANRWFWRDLDAMIAAEGFERSEVAPFLLEAERGDVPGGWPRGGETQLAIRNDHLQYALTWFLLAFCLVVVYGVYLRGRLRAQQAASQVAGKGPGS